MESIDSGSGNNDCFEEKLFHAYQAFGYPCGWSGDYDTGALVVFSLERPL
jgi:hypothetical protein